MRVAALGVSAAKGAQVFEYLRVKHGRTDFVDARGPLAQVDLAAAVGAEREVFAVEDYEFTAGGAAQEFGGFFLGSHGILVSAKRLILIFSLRRPHRWTRPEAQVEMRMRGELAVEAGLAGIGACRPNSTGVQSIVGYLPIAPARVGCEARHARCKEGGSGGPDLMLQSALSLGANSLGRPD